MTKRALFAVLVVALLLPAASEAAFPGANGKIAFVRAGDIWTMNPDGTGQVNLTNSAQVESDPAWSPDGNRIAFTRGTGTAPNFTTQVFVMFADGTGATPVVSDGADPSWSPEGDQLVYVNFDPGISIARVDLDGSNVTWMYFGEDDKYDPEWSPDGTTIAFLDETGNCVPLGYDIYTLESDATYLNATPFNVTNCQGPVNGYENYSLYPNWSPDGQKILFAFDCFECPNVALQTIRPDGTDRATVAEPGGQHFRPAWSPDGSKIVYGVQTAGEFRIRTINANGTNVVDLGLGDAPDWQPLNQAGPEADLLSTITDSPDPRSAFGTLTYTAQAKNLVGPDPATGVTLSVNLPPSVFYISATPSQGSCSQAAGTVTCNFGSVAVGASATVTIKVEPQSPGTITASASVTGAQLDPVPGNNASQTTTTVTYGGYARPKGAPVIRAPLVPAYRGCDSGQATLTHGTPLAAPSCASPALTSGYLTIGTGSVGFVRIRSIGEQPLDPDNGDQADVGYQLQLSDVRKASDLSDYTGELQVQATLRLTDRHSTPSGKTPATLGETAISFDAPCTATATPTGAVCSVSTSADAVVPGIAQEGRRAIWDLGKVRVLDGGADGDTQTAPNTLFAVQGVFVP